MSTNENPTPKTRLTRAKEFVKRNERRILVSTTVVATGAAVLMRTGIKQHNDFLREKGLFDEFYAMGEYETEE